MIVSLPTPRKGGGGPSGLGGGAGADKHFSLRERLGCIWTAPRAQEPTSPRAHERPLQETTDPRRVRKFVGSTQVKPRRGELLPRVRGESPHISWIQSYVDSSGLKWAATSHTVSDSLGVVGDR